MIRSFMKLLIIALSLAPSIGVSGTMEIAVSFSLPQNGTTANFRDGISGFDFTPTVDLTITSLGFYDQGGDGLISDHPVAIFETETQASLASTTVTNDSPLGIANFRFQDIMPLQLFAGTTYTVASFTAGPVFDPEALNPTGGIRFGDGFEFERLRQDFTDGLQFPAQSGEDGAIQVLFLGPNFRYSLATAPEPHVAMLGVVIVGGLLAASHSRRQGSRASFGSAAVTDR